MPDSGDQFVEICSRSVSGIVDLTEGQWSYPGQSDETDEGKSEELFDPNSYLGVLDHLALEPGYELDFVYFEDFLGGKPLVYARQSEEAPFGDYSELIQSLGTPSYRETSYGYLEHAHDYMTLIKTDDTAEGYLQLMILALLADQFYLSWHALYNDYMFMCESSDLDRVMAEIEGFDVEISKEVIEEAKSLDLAPSVLLEEDSATVTYVLFTKWGGFIREWYMVSREYPHEIIDGGYEVLIEYDCGIMF